MQDRKYSLFQVVCMVLIAIAATIGVTIEAMDSNAISEESHLVSDYLIANELPAQFQERFNLINNDWPPSRNKMANLLLDAQVAAFRKLHVH